MRIGEMKAGFKGAITSLLFWLVVVYVPVVVVDVPALLGIDVAALDAADPVRIGVLGFVWGTLVVFAVFGVIAGIRGERQSAWAHRDRTPRRDGVAERDEKRVGEVRPG